MFSYLEVNQGPLVSNFDAVLQFATVKNFTQHSRHRNFLAADVGVFHCEARIGKRSTLFAGKSARIKYQWFCNRHHTVSIMIFSVSYTGLEPRVDALVVEVEGNGSGGEGHDGGDKIDTGCCM